MSQLRRVAKFSIENAYDYDILWRHISDAIEQNKRHVVLNDSFLIAVKTIRLVSRGLEDKQLGLQCPHIYIHGDIFDVQIVFPNKK